jgi:hypothetical protein
MAAAAGACAVMAALLRAATLSPQPAPAPA